MWDLAYYNGKLYVYFGIVPALLILVPYKLITGQYAYIWIVGAVFLVLFTLFLSLLIKKIFTKYFKNVSYKFLVMSCIIVQFGSIYLWTLPRFLIYEFILLCGITFVVMGLYFYFSAYKDDGKINYFMLFIACTCLALAVGCRPTTLLISIIIIPNLFMTFIKKCKEKNISEIIKLILAVAVPYLSIGIFLMYYNYVRFDSIFEFGSNYQLTVNNIKALGIRWTAGIITTIQYIFAAPIGTFQFPFIYKAHNDLIYYSYLYNEEIIGGIIFLSPISILIFAVPFIKKYIDFNNEKNKEIYRYTVLLIIVTLITTFLVGAMGGLIPRYSTDFAYLYSVAGILVFLMLYSNIKNETIKNILSKIFVVVMIFTIYINVFSGLFYWDDSFILKNEQYPFYYYLKYVFTFWQ